MRRADVFLFPSVLEGHPQVLGQSASCGLPVLAMDKYHPTTWSMVNRILVKSDSEFSTKLSLLLSDPELRRKMSAAAARHARQFDWNKVTAHRETVFVEAVERRRRTKMKTS